MQVVHDKAAVCGMRLLALATLALLLREASCQGGGAVTGEAGVPVGSSLAASFAEHDYHLQMLSLAGPWDGFSSSQGLSVEAWVRQTNCFTLDTPLFAYSIRTPLTGRAEAKELALELSSMPTTGYWGLPVWRYKGSLLMPTTLSATAPSPRTCGQWDHIVTTLDLGSGAVAAYLNGSQVYSYSFPLTNLSTSLAPHPGGFLQMGADMGVSLDGRAELTAVSVAPFAVDVFRVYNRTLGGAEVGASVWAFDPPPSTIPNLMLHWRFDNPDGAIETDLSGNGNHGHRGASGNLDFPDIYRHATPQGVITARVHPPKFVISPVPVSGASAVTALAVPGTVVELLLAPSSPASCTLLSVPGDGALRLPDDAENGTEPTPLSAGALLPACRVRYSAPEGAGFASGDANFSFRVGEDGLEGRAAVYAASPCVPPEYPPMGLDDEAAGPFDRRVLLGGLCSDGQMALVEVVRLPKGIVAVAPHRRLADPLLALLDGDELPNMDDLLVDNSTDLLRAFPPLPSAPALITVNDPGAVLFAALPGPRGALATFIEYRWLSPFADSTVVRRLDITRQGPDRMIQMLPPNFSEVSSERGGSLLRIEFNAEIMDMSAPIDLEVARPRPPVASVDNDVLHFQVTRGPFFGTLYQVTEEGEQGAPLSRFGLESPMLEYQASMIPEFRAAWGPAWSSQQTACPTCCAHQSTCNPSACSEQLVFPMQCASDAASFHASNLIDGVDGTLYKSACVECGRQWFVVGIAEPLYIRGIQITLAGVEGHITEISGSNAYAGNLTEWVPIWQAAGALEPLAIVGLEYFEPVLCEHQPTAMRWLRVEYDTSNASSLPGFGGVRVEGTLAPHSSAVHSSRSELLYRPLPGVDTAMKESIEVSASDCDSWAEPETYELPLASIDAGEGATSGVFGELQRVTVDLRQRVEIELDVAEPWAFQTGRLEGLLQGQQPTSLLEVEDFEVVLEAQKQREADEGLPLRVYNVATGEALPTDEASKLGHFTRVLIEHNSLSPKLLHFQVTLQGVVYRLGVEVSSRCPADANIFECAHSPSECFEADCELHSAECGSLGSGEPTVVFDALNMRCKVTTGSRQSRLTQLQITLGAAFAALLVLAAFVVFLWFKKRTSRHSGAPPMQGEMVTLVTTDIHGSTTLWDSFPEQVAADIALHHECLRASLKSCNGYEIATEGDSFKCAFSTPEDAICWSILSQLDLLCAPWSVQLEDGGHALLASRDDWANCEGAPVVSRGAADVIDGMATTENMSHVWAAMEKGALMRPHFDPKLVVASEFCKQWCISKGEEESAAAYGPEGLLLPVFRGLRVRVGIHTGVADVVETNPITRRVVYGGSVAKIAKLVSDAPCGGQIVMSGDTLAEVQSMQDLMERVATLCAGWRHGESVDDPHASSAMSVLSLGSHLLTEIPRIKSQVSGSTDAEIDDSPGSGLTSNGDLAIVPVASTGAIAKISQALRSKRGTLTAAGIPKMGQNCKLPPSLGGDRLIDDLIEAVGGDDDEDDDDSDDGSSSTKDEPQGRVAVGTAEEQLLRPRRSMLKRSMSYISRGDKTAQRQAEAELLEAHELIMVVPWPLKARALYYPPVKSVKALTHSWDAAPVAGGVTILFAFLEGAAQLKEMVEKEESSRAILQLQAVVRNQLVKHKGYEVEVEEGNFVCAFHNALDAVLFSVSVQQALMAVRWSPLILGHPWAAEQRTATNELIFRGLRLSIGMCTGNAMRVQPCIRTGKMEYYGPIMNHAARTAVAAHGGQVLLHESSWNEVVECKEAGREVDNMLFRNMGTHSLKGITRNVHIIQAIPPALASRSFPAIKTKNVNLAMRRPSAPAPLLKLEKLEVYLAGVDGISSPSSPDKPLPARRVPRSVRMPDMTLASSLKRVRKFVQAALPFGRFRHVARRVLGLQRERVTHMRRPSMLASVADQALAVNRTHRQTDGEYISTDTDLEHGLKTVPGKHAWTDVKSCPEIAVAADSPRHVKGST